MRACIAGKGCFWNALYCVVWNVKSYSFTHSLDNLSIILTICHLILCRRLTAILRCGVLVAASQASFHDAGSWPGVWTLLRTTGARMRRAVEEWKTNVWGNQPHWKPLRQPSQSLSLSLNGAVGLSCYWLRHNSWF